MAEHNKYQINIRIILPSLCLFVLGLFFHEFYPLQMNIAMVDFMSKNPSFIPISRWSDLMKSLTSWIQNDIHKFNTTFHQQSITHLTDKSSNSVISKDNSEISLSTNFSSESNSANPMAINFNQTNNESYKILMNENSESLSLENISDVSSLPPWSNFPRTEFTDHVLEVLKNLNASEFRECKVYVKVHVQEPYSVPSIECHHEDELHDTWCVFLTRIFVNKRFPYSISFGFLLSDKFDSITLNHHCIKSSSSDNVLMMPIMEVIVGWNNPEMREISWENRSTIPVFRGTGWEPATYGVHDCVKPDFNYSEFFQEPCFQAVLFSHNYPSLLDAKLSCISWLIEDCFSFNATNGLDKLLPVESVNIVDYFSSSPQVALVLPGIGAPFRHSKHMMYGTAAALQDWVHQEWFTKYLTPFEHFIPLARDLSNLNETLHWIMKHPNEVKKIASNGRAFWEKYLSFLHNDDLIYELVYRLSEKMNDNVTVA